jgi:hypothetical protein
MSHLLLFSAVATLTGTTSYKKTVAFIVPQRERLNAVFGACFRRVSLLRPRRRGGSSGGRM